MIGLAEETGLATLPLGVLVSASVDLIPPSVPGGFSLEGSVAEPCLVLRVPLSVSLISVSVGEFSLEGESPEALATEAFSQLIGELQLTDSDSDAVEV